MKHFILLIIVVLNVWDAKNQHVYMNDEISSALTASPATSVASKITFVGWTVMMKMMVARDQDGMNVSRRAVTVPTMRRLPTITFNSEFTDIGSSGKLSIHQQLHSRTHYIAAKTLIPSRQPAEHIHNPDASVRIGPRAAPPPPPHSGPGCSSC